MHIPSSSLYVVRVTLCMCIIYSNSHLEHNLQQMVRTCTKIFSDGGGVAIIGHSSVALSLPQQHYLMYNMIQYSVITCTCLSMHTRNEMKYILSLCSYVQSWIDSREVQSEKANLTILFDRYIPTCLETLRVRFKKITPVTGKYFGEILQQLQQQQQTVL